ncbi:traB domain-containing protein isoform X2 [Parasteatoda tepidariorum]|uniref:traB domain-containing protein isoform X2 n=1 Tax=Parasteatoda tepidariorum TaxID=114398 RepID=UPI001C728349|nr:traB domain-containing protein isoform X2 [Parasteatoda tepidariorum]
MWNAKTLINLRNFDTFNFFIKRSISLDSRSFSSRETYSVSLSVMEENGKIESLASDPSKVSYASILAKGTLHTDDQSNNNPDSEGGNENHQNSPTNSSAISEENKNSFTPDSLSDSFEDAEEDQSNFNSFSASDSILSNGTLTKEDTPSSLVTECSSENQCNDLDVHSSSSVDEEESEDESENDRSGFEDTLYPTAMKWKFRSTQSIEDLPNTVTVLETKNGSKVFVVGTAHFSLESQEDVAKTIRAVQPDIVVIELCKSRLNVLSLDENTILEEAKTLNFQKIKQTIAENGVLQGVLYFLLLSMSAHLTKQLGMAPGGEFRRAYEEAKQIPGCIVHLGDRPIHITLQRALAKLSMWQKIRIGWHMLRSKDPISKEEVERCKQRDLLEEMLAEMTGEFPELSQVFVKERDIYLTYSLQMAASPIVAAAQNSDIPGPSYVVGVVGIGHVPGIQEHWGKITNEDIPPVLCIPEPSRSSKFIRYTIRYSLYGLGLYGIYKVFPRSLLSSRILDVIKEPFRR